MVAKAPAKKKSVKKTAAARKPRAIGVVEGDKPETNGAPKQRGKKKSQLTIDIETDLAAGMPAKMVAQKHSVKESKVYNIASALKRKAKDGSKRKGKKVKPAKVSGVRIIGDSGNNGLLSSGLALLKAAGSFAAARAALDTLEEIRSVKL